MYTKLLAHVRFLFGLSLLEFLEICPISSLDRLIQELVVVLNTCLVDITAQLSVIVNAIVLDLLE